MCGSTCFGRLPARHQEHTTALGTSGFTVGGSGWSVVGHSLADHDQQRSSRFSPTVKPEAPMQLYAPDDGRGDGGNMLTTLKRRVINLWNCCILLVELFDLYDDARTCERRIYNRLIGKIAAKRNCTYCITIFRMSLLAEYFYRIMYLLFDSPSIN
jgi:hypothetical protein